MASSSALNLEDVPSVDLMTELLRRMKCSTKPDKRLILIGLSLSLYRHVLYIYVYITCSPLPSFFFLPLFLYIFGLFCEIKRCIQIL